MTQNSQNENAVLVGDCWVGAYNEGQKDIIVQSMTNTDTANVETTVKQIYELWQAGSQLVRVTVNNEESAQAIPEIVDRLGAAGC